MGKIVETECPQCRSKLWVDAENGSVVQHARSKRKKISSFDELLEKEKQKKKKVNERFLQAKELDEAKKRKAREIFQQSLKQNK